MLEQRRDDVLFGIFHRIFDTALKKSSQNGVIIMIEDQSQKDE